MDSRKVNAQEKESQPDFIYRGFTIFQHSGDSIFLFLLFLILFFVSSESAKKMAGLVLTGMTLSGFTVFVLKQVFRKERPAGTAGKMYRKYDRFSFPSGHAARAWTIALTTAFLHWPLAIALFVWAGVISYSRLKLNLHDVADVVAGTLVGLFTGLIAVWIFYLMIF